MYLGVRLAVRECLHREYKEFCLKNNICEYYDQHTIKGIVGTGILPKSFNHVVYDSLKRYIYDYVPKYASAFSNTNLGKEKIGTLYIGINDFGEVTGIPLVGTDIDMDFINKHVNRATSMCLKGVDDVTKKAYTDKIKVTITKLKKDTNLLCDTTQELLNMMVPLEREYNESYSKYLNDRDEWVRNIKMYSSKLELVLHEAKADIITFIGDASPSAKAALSTPEFLHIDISNLEEKKNDPDHYIYWLIRYKDLIIGNLLQNKPRPPLMPRCFSVPFNMITHLSELRHKIVKNTPDVKYYMLTIEFPGNDGSGVALAYKNNFEDTWDIRKRIYDPNDIYGPCVMPTYGSSE